MQIPDNIRPALDVIVKYHFWMLAAVVPLIVVPLASLAARDLVQTIDAKRSAIDAKLSSVKSVQGIPEHPNERWAETLGRDATGVKRDTFAQWQRLYDEQSQIRVWPESLGEDFVERASMLQPGGRLPRKLLERYQDAVKNIVRTLPQRMGAEDRMPTATDDERGSARNIGAPAAARVRPQSVVRWSEADQKRLYDSFDWLKPPTTVQVQLAQEEIWMYQILCDVVKEMNTSATGGFDAVIPVVDELSIGYPAAEDKPGGTGEGRILRVKSVTVPGDEPAPGGGGPEAAVPPARPSHPRFAAGGGRGGFDGQGPSSSPAAEAGEGPSPDDIFRNWIYVDFDGKPLMASEQAASLANRMIHLIPFRLQAVIDQRRLDDLLSRLATSPIPIDVRQVRINPGASIQRPGTPASESGGSAGRLYDVRVDIRGSIALAATPDRKAVLGDLAADETSTDSALQAEDPPAADEAN